MTLERVRTSITFVESLLGINLWPMLRANPLRRKVAHRVLAELQMFIKQLLYYFYISAFQLAFDAKLDGWPINMNEYRVRNFKERMMRWSKLHTLLATKII